MSVVKRLLKTTNELTQTGDSRREEAESVVAKLSKEIGVPKSHVTEYALVLLNQVMTQHSVSLEYRPKKEKMRLRTHGKEPIFFT